MGPERPDYNLSFKPRPFLPDKLDANLAPLERIGSFWEFGPFSFSLRGDVDNGPLVVDWRGYGLQTRDKNGKSFGFFSDVKAMGQAARKWRYLSIETPKGSYYPNVPVRQLYLFKTDADGVVDSSSFACFTYFLNQTEGVNFSARIPDLFGNSVILSSPVWPRTSALTPTTLRIESGPFHPSHYKLGAEMFRLFGGPPIEGVDFFPFQRGQIGIESLLKWLKLEHIRFSERVASSIPDSDVLRMFQLNVGEPFTSGVLLENLTGIPPRNENFVGAAEVLLTHVGSELDEGSLLPLLAGSLPGGLFKVNSDGMIRERTLRRAAALVIVVHENVGWCNPYLDLETVKFLVGKRATGRPMSGRFSVISGKMEEGEINSATGSVLTCLREAAEETRMVISEKGGSTNVAFKLTNLTGLEGLSASPVLVPGGYIDLTHGEQFGGFSVATGILIVGGSGTNKLGFSWSREGAGEFEGDPILMTGREILTNVDKFHPGVLFALSQAFKLLARLGPVFARELILGAAAGR